MPEGATGPVADEPLGRAHRGQIYGAPEDGESFDEVVDENAAPDLTRER